MSTNAPISNKPKRFIPLENNPEVMSTLLHTLGLSRTLSFHDVYSISDPSLLSFVPRPALALLLVFPVSAVYETHRHSEDASLTFPSPYLSATTTTSSTPPILWYRQTIGNACGLIALLHAASNGDARGYVEKGSELDQLVESAEKAEGDEARAKLVEESGALERAHREAAVLGDTSAPGEEESVELHFVCFVKSGGRMWEMDGRRKGAIERGELGDEEDVLSEKALDLGVRAFLKREEEAGGGELRFSLIALAPGFD